MCCTDTYGAFLGYIYTYMVYVAMKGMAELKIPRDMQHGLHDGVGSG